MILLRSTLKYKSHTAHTLPYSLRFKRAFHTFHYLIPTLFCRHGTLALTFFATSSCYHRRRRHRPPPQLFNFSSIYTLASTSTCLPPLHLTYHHRHFVVFHNLQLRRDWFRKGDRYFGTWSERCSLVCASLERDGDYDNDGLEGVRRCRRFVPEGDRIDGGVGNAFNWFCCTKFWFF